MEIQRTAAASTFVTFPMLSNTGVPQTGLTVVGSWVAWADTAGPNAAGNPGFRTLTGAVTELGTSGVYTNALASTELPAASPYVLLRYATAGVATQYLLVRTASFFTNVSGINGSTIATPVTAGYMPMDVKQTIALTGMADNSVEKALARTYFATQYVDAAISSRSAPATGQTVDTVSAGAISSASFAAGAIDAAAIAADAIGSSELAADGASEYADAFLGRTLNRGASGGRTVGQSLMALRNRVSISAGTLTVYGTDDATAEWTATIATESVSAIVTSVDPA